MKELLKKHFGYNEFRPKQLEIIENVLDNKDTLVFMPTGGGKSLCYQIPALKFKGLTIVISPLISLMKDQVDALQMNGINAEYINSTLREDEINDIKIRIENNEIKLLYIAPERLVLKSFKIFISNIEVSLIAIDEAHCISEWGHDFRKDYKNLRFLKDIFPKIPIIALTATATPKVKTDLLKQLKLKKPKIFTSSFNRDNLKLIVRKKIDSLAQILCLLEKNKNESTIIYCHSRKETKEISDQLKKYGFNSIIYHGGLSSKIREKNQELFINDKANIIVATIAFGMGIDKSNVRLVIHNTFSKSIEGYYQEIGRAGRDGILSECVLFYSNKDKHKHDFFINMISDRTLRIGNNNKLDKIISYCESKICRRKYILEYFGEEYTNKNCNACDICLKLPTNTKKLINKSIVKKNALYDKSLLIQLKSLRKTIGNNLNINPSNIFGDISLRKMATSFPSNNKEFLEITGIVEQKLNDFGEEFLILINKHLKIDKTAKKLKKTNLTIEKSIKPKIKKKKYYRKKK